MKILLRKGLKVFDLVFIPIIYIRCLFAARKKNYLEKPRLLWGPTPILNNKYWSEAMKAAGYKSATLMMEVYSINNTKDFDFILPAYIKVPSIVSKIFPSCKFYLGFIKAIENFDILHIPTSGFLLNATSLRLFEPFFLKTAKVKTVAIPYGGDFYRYSQIRSPILLHALLKSYPKSALMEKFIADNVSRWVNNADFFIPGIQLDGIGRWDVLTPSVLNIDYDLWEKKIQKSNYDGKNGTVNIIHTPNHRGFKGTEFIINAVEELKAEGLLVELMLIEKKTNEEVRRIMQYEADMLAEQIIFPGYALSGLEGMSCGIPVLSNLDIEEYTHVFRLYSFLNECPILSTTPSSIKENLKILIRGCW
jgi:hypothetical protein